MKTLLLALALIISGKSFASQELANRICGSDATLATLKSNWDKDHKGRYCATANCTYPSGKKEVERCFFDDPAGAENLIIVSRAEFQSASYKGTAIRVYLNAEEPCLQQCLPEKKLFKTYTKLQRKECVECFKERVFTAEEGDLTYPELGRVIRKGQKCHSLCVDKPGPIQIPRVLTDQCKSCLNERFMYLMTQTGKCYEIDQRYGAYNVDPDFCYNKNAQIIRTTFILIGSLTDMIFGKEKTCYEVDEETRGQIFKRQTAKSNCEPSVDNSDRSITNDKNNRGTSPASKKNGVSKQ